MSQLSHGRTATLIVAMQPPAEIYVAPSRWNINAEFRIRGIEVDGNDTPWVTDADLLVDSEGEYFVGLTFRIDNREYWEPMKRIAERLDPRVVRYNDISTSEAQRMYPGEAGNAHRFEITWAPVRSLRYELSQLCCGQWFWWYAKQGSWGVSPPIIALGITDIDEILDAHNLKFPEKLEFPLLEVEFA